jgi:hypothetical protein
MFGGFGGSGASAVAEESAILRQKAREGISTGLQNMFGVRTPEQQLQTIIQQAQKQFDLGTPQGLTGLADMLNQVPELSGMAMSIRQEAAKMASQAGMAGLKAEEMRANIGLKQAQTANIMTEMNRPPPPPSNKVLPPGAVMVSPTGEVLARGESVADRPTPPSNSKKMYDELIALGVSPAEARRVAYKMPTEGQQQEEGFKVGFDKTGKYTNVFGEVISASEMGKQRAGFEQAQKLLERLNTITDKDIRNAEATIDYTEGKVAKAAGGTFFPRTLEAQTKIAASQLLQQIESLPPGSASNADMQASAKEFPGYADARALRSWVTRTKELLESSLARQSENFGFRRTVKASSTLGSGQQQQATPQAPSRNPVATKRFNPATGQLEDIR